MGGLSTRRLGHQSSTLQTRYIKAPCFSAFPNCRKQVLPVFPRPNDDDGRWVTTSSGVASFDNGYGSNVAKSDVILIGGGNVNAVTGSGNGYNFIQMVAAFKKNLPNERKPQGFVWEIYTVVPNQWIVDTLITKVGHGGVPYSETYITLSSNQGTIMIFSQANRMFIYRPGIMSQRRSSRATSTVSSLMNPAYLQANERTAFSVGEEKCRGQN